MILKKIILVLLMSSCTSILFASKLNLKIDLPKSINSEKLVVLLDNGYEQKVIKILFKENKGFINENVFSPYASVIFVYPNKYGGMYGANFLVKVNAAAYIKFSETNELDTNRLIKSITKNAIDISKSKEYSTLKKYCKTERINNISAYAKYDKIKNDSTLNLYNLSSIKLALKQLEFLSKIKWKQYYYSWFFRTDIVPNLNKTHKKEILDFFDNNLPESYQKSDEGLFLREKLAGSLYVKEGTKAPQFAALDYKGDSVSLKKFKGKYVLVDFWATWCAPCIEKIPTIKKIRDDYDTNYLEIISITYDRDSIKFINGIKQYELNWLHIFGNPQIKNAYGDTPIPALYLIDPNGKICYSSWENPIEKIFDILKQLKK